MRRFSRQFDVQHFGSNLYDPILNLIVVRTNSIVNSGFEHSWMNDEDLILMEMGQHARSQAK
jgi:hypothetical protein